MFNKIPDNGIYISKTLDEISCLIYKNGELEYFQVNDAKNDLGSIYTATVIKIFKNINSAFLKIGPNEGFISLSDIDKFTSHGKSLKNGDRLLVQVQHTGTDDKKPKLTCNVKIVGRSVILSPMKNVFSFSQSLSQKRCSQILKLKKENPDLFNIGIIIRTYANQANDSEVIKELKCLRSEWDKLISKSLSINKSKKISCGESEILKAIVHGSNIGVKKIYFDDDLLLKEILQPSQKIKAEDLKVEKINSCILNFPHVLNDIKNLNASTIHLSCGGTVIIEETEAMTVIDVNSGNSDTEDTKSFSENILHVNEEATKAIAGQIKLRNIGGILVVDFIDMKSISHNLKIKSLMSRMLKKSKAKYSLTDISKFGIMEISRQKIGKSINSYNKKTCRSCCGTGKVFRSLNIASKLIRLISIQKPLNQQVLKVFIDEETMKYIKLHGFKKNIVKATDEIKNFVSVDIIELKESESNRTFIRYNDANIYVE